MLHYQNYKQIIRKQPSPPFQSYHYIHTLTIAYFRSMAQTNVQTLLITSIIYQRRNSMCCHHGRLVRGNSNLVTRQKHTETINYITSLSIQHTNYIQSYLRTSINTIAACTLLLVLIDYFPSRHRSAPLSYCFYHTFLYPHPSV